MNPKRFSELREAAGFTQSQLADHFNLSVRTVASWESGERKPPIDKLEALADLYHVQTDYLLGRSTKKQPDESIAGLREEVIQLLNGLSEEECRRVEDFVAGLKAGREAGAAVQRSAHPEVH